MPRLFLLMLLVLSTTLGCGGEYKIAPVSGKVTLDGEPLAGALLSFEPLAQGDSQESGYGSYAECDDQGQYRIKSLKGEDGAIIGPHMVMVTTFKMKEGPNGENIPVSKEKVPARYNTYGSKDIIRFEVPREGTDQANFDLTTKP